MQYEDIRKEILLNSNYPDVKRFVSTDKRIKLDYSFWEDWVKRGYNLGELLREKAYEPILVLLKEGYIENNLELSVNIIENFSPSGIKQLLPFLLESIHNSKELYIFLTSLVKRQSRIINDTISFMLEENISFVIPGISLFFKYFSYTIRSSITNQILSLREDVNEEGLQVEIKVFPKDIYGEELSDLIRSDVIRADEIDSDYIPHKLFSFEKYYGSLYPFNSVDDRIRDDFIWYPNVLVDNIDNGAMISILFNGTITSTSKVKIPIFEIFCFKREEEYLTVEVSHN